MGENLIKANSANEALEHLLRNEIAVVLIDVCMPDLDGFELAAMIREHPRFQRTAIIFVSAIQLTRPGPAARLRRRARWITCRCRWCRSCCGRKVRVFADLYRKTRQLEQLNSELERRVAERTAELAQANAELEQRVEERTREREAALAQVHEMQKLESLGQLTGGVAHDFNNLLMVILGNLQLLRKRLPDDPRLLRLVDGAMQGADRGATLTKRMLAFARRQELRPETVDVPRLVDGMEEMLRRTLGPSIQIVTDISSRSAADPRRSEPARTRAAEPGAERARRDAAWRTTGDRRAQYDGSARTVRRSLRPGAIVCLSVSDTGAGMDEATLKRAAEPFFTTKGAGKGTGLGLSMVHGLAAQSGGADAHDQPAGRGHDGRAVAAGVAACGDGRCACPRTVHRLAALAGPVACWWWMTIRWWWRARRRCWRISATS